MGSPTPSNFGIILEISISLGCVRGVNMTKLNSRATPLSIPFAIYSKYMSYTLGVEVYVWVREMNPSLEVYTCAQVRASISFSIHVGWCTTSLKVLCYVFDTCSHILTLMSLLCAPNVC